MSTIRFLGFGNDCANDAWYHCPATILSCSANDGDETVRLVPQTELPSSGLSRLRKTADQNVQAKKVQDRTIILVVHERVVGPSVWHLVV